ncbi:MAG: 16S rRNA (guanine(527)-N(7))-methyltransferase RsmG [Spirochaetaceae bacterium]|jgi:16S rRNA (guanine527-N7)-methyltransferase|nr:16S rRNA (guanine(527)-N(7))-methyltransferase RsmG [Spirochaetaceae bacterium]
MNLLLNGLQQLGIPRDEHKESLLLQYMEEIELWNPKYGLVKVDNRDELVIRHILDSLAGLKIIQNYEPQNIADLGSGAGLPGIPLAIYMPQCHFTLVERMGKRCSFLDNCLLQLRLKNVTVENTELKQIPGPFDLVTHRAFRPFEEDILKHILRIIPPGGVMAAYKGKRDKTQEEYEQIKQRFSSGEVMDMKVPFLKAERVMLLMIG